MDLGDNQINKTSTVDAKVKMPNLQVVEFVDKTIAKPGDSLTYSVGITNIGNEVANNVVFKNFIPGGVNFVDESIAVNGIPDIGATPTTGINLGTLNLNESIKVSFKVKIKNVSCPWKILNIAKVNFQYIFDRNVYNEKAISNQVVTDIGITNFKQLNRENYIEIPDQKPDVEDILNTIVDIQITNTKVIRTPIIKSIEGQKLTGFKLIIEGLVNEKIEYIASNKEQSVHAIYYKAPFSTFIVLPENYIEGAHMDIKHKIEDICIKIIDARTIFENISFMLTVCLF